MERLFRFNIHLKGLIFTLFILFYLSLETTAQTKEDLKLVSGLVSAPQIQGHSHFPKGQKNVVKFVESALFYFYQEYISSQDGSHCTFYPSCSAYARQSIRKKGLFIGLLCTFDRLTRCNGLNNDKYPMNQKTGLLYDPVD
jgi:putative component of membrane protein insertase Oxa1/YidC/SpoIIIJ protein YidD